MAQKKKSVLLKRPRSITGEKFTAKSLKPQKARQLIRRFHVLQKNKHSILTKINKLPGVEGDITLENYKEKVLGSTESSKWYHNTYNNFKLKENGTDLIRLEDKLTLKELIHQLALIDSEIDQRGGLSTYQYASTQGQNNNRGGDSSKKLVEWLKSSTGSHQVEQSLIALEIGSLSPENAISTCGIFKSVTRIDLNSQNPLILKQNFMERPLPNSDNERFDLISCSLVINFVPSPSERGQMLARIVKFLKKPSESVSPRLFLVLPLPCIRNSRYFDDKKLQSIMTHLGFVKSQYYEAKKVAYWLYDWTGEVSSSKVKFGKKELYSGSTRNNFCITLE